ncbi:MAG TPA: hypothetical protein VLK84_21970, partial [Longimicrobium sp.]|nr:hypothetical protein [Longimicrobium sp.]
MNLLYDISSADRDQRQISRSRRQPGIVDAPERYDSAIYTLEVVDGAAKPASHVLVWYEVPAETDP